MKKIIRKIGNSLGITFSKEQQLLEDIKEGDKIKVDIEKIVD